MRRKKEKLKKTIKLKFSSTIFLSLLAFVYDKLRHNSNNKKMNSVEQKNSKMYKNVHLKILKGSINLLDSSTNLLECLTNRPPKRSKRTN